MCFAENATLQFKQLNLHINKLSILIIKLLFQYLQLNLQPIHHRLRVL